MNRIYILILSLLAFSVGGCVIASKLGTPGRDEKIVPAEFDLKQQQLGNVLILAHGTDNNREIERLSYNIYLASKSTLVSKEILPSDRIVDFREYVKLKKMIDVSSLSPVEIGRQLGADTVIELIIEDYELTRIPGTNYYQGNMKLGGLVHDVDQGWALWPEDGFSKQVTVGFDIENGGYETSLKRLAVSGTHCITRYLYDCKLTGFKIFDENTNSQW